MVSPLEKRSSASVFSTTSTFMVGRIAPSLLAHLNIDPSYKEFVGEILNGTEQPEFESVDRRRREPQFGYELKAIVDADGNEHQPGGGGVDMVSLESPIKNIIQNTRLGNDLSEGDIPRCSD